MPDDLAGIEAIVFDLDNTLYSRDSAVNAWIESIFWDSPELAQEAIGYDNSGFVPRPDFYTWIDERVEWSNGWKEVEARFQEEVFQFVKADAANENAVIELAKSYRLGILTNGDGGFQLKKFVALGLDTHFDAKHVFATGDIGHHKPDLEAFTPVIASLELSPEKILFVGDNPENDIVGAANAGMRTAWIRLYADHQCAIRPDLTIQSVADLPTALGS